MGSGTTTAPTVTEADRPALEAIDAIRRTKAVLSSKLALLNTIEAELSADLTDTEPLGLLAAIAPEFFQPVEIVPDRGRPLADLLAAVA